MQENKLALKSNFTSECICLELFWDVLVIYQQCHRALMNKDTTRVKDGGGDEDDADGVRLMDGGEGSDRCFFQGKPAKVPPVFNISLLITNIR